MTDCWNIWFTNEAQANMAAFALSVPSAAVPPRPLAVPHGLPRRFGAGSVAGGSSPQRLGVNVLVLTAAGSTYRRASRRTVRQAVDLPVREPEVKSPTVALPGAKVEEETKQKRADEYRLVLFNDPLNKREYVARCLMTICLLKEGDAYQVMMKAHKEGVAVVGTYAFETAEAYCESLKTQGLSVDIFPVDKDD